MSKEDVEEDKDSSSKESKRIIEKIFNKYREAYLQKIRGSKFTPNESETIPKQKKIVPNKNLYESMYKQISLVLKYPYGGHGGESFWRSMKLLYGQTFLTEETSSQLRSKWRSIKNFSNDNITITKEVLKKTLPKDFIDKIDKEIDIVDMEIASKELTNQAYSRLFPNTPKTKEVRKKQKYAVQVTL